MTPRKLFTVEEANATLPLVRVVVRDLVELGCRIQHREESLVRATATRQPGSEAKDPYDEEILQSHEDLRFDKQALGDLFEELRELGAEAKGIEEGLVDFPAIKDGRLILLCWKLGEPSITHWHEVDAGYLGRQPITDEFARAVQAESAERSDLASSS